MAGADERPLERHPGRSRAAHRHSDAGAADQAWFDRLRGDALSARAQSTAAHLTLFHACRRCSRTSCATPRRLAAELPPPRAEVVGLMNLGGGVAFRIVSEDLDAIRAELAERFAAV